MVQWFSLLFVYLSLNLPIRNSWSELQSAPSLSVSIFKCKEYNQSNFGTDHLVLSMCCRAVSCVVGKGCLLWPVHSLGKTLLAFVLLNFALQGQTCLLLQASPDFLLLQSSPLWGKGHLFLVLVLEGHVGLHRTCDAHGVIMSIDWGNIYKTQCLVLSKCLTSVLYIYVYI